jgi:hypothetical protein
MAAVEQGKVVVRLKIGGVKGISLLVLKRILRPSFLIISV